MKPSQLSYQLLIDYVKRDSPWRTVPFDSHTNSYYISPRVSKNPENKGFIHKNFENKKAWKVVFPIIASLIFCGAATDILFISDYGWVNRQTETSQEVNISYQIPADPAQLELISAQEFLLAEAALPEIRVSQDEEIEEGDYGVIFQSGSTTPSELSEKFDITLESDKQLTYIMYAFVFAHDRDPQSARITIADLIYINLNSRAVSVAGFAFRQIRDGHDGDIENLLMVFEREVQQNNPTTYELELVAVAPKQHTNGFIEIPLNQLTLNPDGRLVFNAQEDKNALSQNERSCQDINVRQYPLIKLNGYGCYAEAGSRPLEITITKNDNVGESYSPNNPFSISPHLANFSHIDAWDPDPFNEGRAFFEWVIR